MKIIISIIIAFLAGGWLGANYFQEPASQTSSEAAPAEKKPLYWVAPMDKNYRRDGPGLSPMGMELVPVYADEADIAEAEGDVLISAAVENNLGVKTGRVNFSKLSQHIRTIGTVQFDESKIQHIHSRVEGWIEVLNIASSGDAIRKGQILYEIYSPALVNAQEEFLAALRSNNQNLISASKSRLMALGLSSAQVRSLEEKRKVDQRVKVRAEMDGVVIALNIRQGMFIKPATEVLSVGSLDSVWILGEVFERQAYLVQEGQIASIQVNAMPDRQWQGAVSYIYPELDKQTRTLRVRIDLPNTDHLLKPNMLANLTIVSTSAEPVLNIPRQAVIKDNHKTRVVKALGNGRFQSVLVEVGAEGYVYDDPSLSEARIQILSGLAEGDKVVTSAQFLIDSESNIEAELGRMESMDYSAMADEEMDHSTMDHSTMDHGTMDHGSMEDEEMDHSTMDHSTMDHSTMNHEQMNQETMNHEEMQHAH